MNTNPQLDQSQLDLHPDAESLSAFAEHQLPEHQRQPILAHLASCAQCRQILFLAQDAKEPEQPANPGPVLHFSAKKPATNWRYTWGALAACTALATISVLLYPRYRTAVPEQAKVITPLQTPAGSIAAPPTEEKKPRSEPSATIPQLHRAEKPAPKSEMNLDAAVAPSAPAKPAVQQPAAQQQASAGSSTTLMNITLKPAQTSQTVEVQAANQALTQSESQTVNVAANSAQIQPETPPLAVTMDAQQLQPNDQIKLQSRNVQPSGARHPAPTSTAVSGGTGNGLTPGAGGSIHAGAAGGSGASAAAAAKSPAAFAKMAPRPLTVTPEDETAAHNALGKVLPTGLPAIASASASHHLLAIDSAGALFLSEDAGAVWEPVSSQWTGRAVLVLSPQAAPDQTRGLAIMGRATADQPAPAAAPAPAPVPPALFEIVNDQGIHWTSSDGRSWKTK